MGQSRMQKSATIGFNFRANQQSVELEGIYDYPEERSGDRYAISAQGWETEEGEFEARLSDRPAAPHSRAQLTAPDSCHAVNRVS